MILTRIEKENMEYFAHLCPVQILRNEDLFVLGVIDDEKEAAGVCASKVVDNMISIEWLYTAPEKRDGGIATTLLNALTIFAQGFDIHGMLVNYSERAENMDEFLTESGFLVVEDRGFYSVPISELIYARAFDSEPESNDRLHTYTLTEREGQRIVHSMLEAHNLNMGVLTGVSLKLSAVYKNTADGSTGGIFVSDSGEDDLFVNYLLSNGSITGLSSVVRFFRDNLISENRVKGNLVFTDRSAKAVTLVDGLLEGDCDDYVIPERMQAVRLFI